ncbi:MAG: fibronectin type III domain-containing protein [Patescibacteria group bacterium]
MNKKNSIIIGALALAILGVSPSQTNALNLNLSNESEVRINDKIESYLELKADAKEDVRKDGERINNDNARASVTLESKAKVEDKKEIRQENRFANWLKQFIKKENKVNQLRINGGHLVSATSTASISWKTNVQAEGYVMFSEDRNIATSSTKIVSSTGLSTEHKVTLSGLKPGTVYYYAIGSKDASGKVLEEKIKSFKTKKEAVVENAALKVLFANEFNIEATKANVIWITNKPTNSKIWVSATSTVDTTGTPTLSFTEMSYFHNLSLANLATSTTYYYVAGGVDAEGNTILSTKGSFTTEAR